MGASNTSGGRRDQPSHYIFVANRLEGDDMVRARTILERLAGRGLWLLNKRTPFRGRYKPGDLVLFYLAGEGERQFVGQAVLASEVEPATDEERDLLRGLGIFGFGDRLRLKDVVTWERPVPIAPLIERLAFITNKKYWGHHFRMGAVSISAEDYETVLVARTEG
ncbi:MAG TPA: EVE domain-containing protein [Armatimonadota bacterium]|jgi:predicted RNA-binding protein